MRTPQETVFASIMRGQIADFRPGGKASVQTAATKSVRTIEPLAKPPPRLHTDQPLTGDPVALSKEQAHYLGTVLRLGEGADLLLFNGTDGEWSARIGGLSRKGGHADLAERTRQQTAGPDLTLLFAPLKKGPTDLVIRMGTELGVRRFVPVLTARTQAERVKVERLALIATEAAEQCERLEVPGVSDPIRFADVLEAPGPLLFCDEAGDEGARRGSGGAGRGQPVGEALSVAVSGPWSILIGPEGGFAPDERSALRERASTTAVTLGPRILKAETAALTAVALWQAMVGDLSTSAAHRSAAYGPGRTDEPELG